MAIPLILANNQWLRQPPSIIKDPIQNQRDVEHTVYLWFHYPLSNWCSWIALVATMINCPFSQSLPVEIKLQVCTRIYKRKKTGPKRKSPKELRTNQNNVKSIKNYRKSSMKSFSFLSLIAHNEWTIPLFFLKLFF